MTAKPGMLVRDHTKAVKQAIEGVLRGVATDGAKGVQDKLFKIVLSHEETRSMKDRAWAAPFGFDMVQGDAQ